MRERPAPPPRLLLLGASVRALAASAARGRLAAERFPGGLLALDFFADADLLSLPFRGPLTALSLARDLGRKRSILSLARAALYFDWDAVAYAGGMENRPGLLRRLEGRGAVLGNGAEVVRRVRDPGILFPFLRRLGIPHPATWSGRERPAPRRGRRLLWKGARSGGGARVRMVERRGGRSRGHPRGHYAQEFLAGPVGSVAFVADGRRAAILGVTEQIVGWRALGGSGFRYGGNIAGPPEALLPAGALSILSEAAGAITGRFGLRGLNGIDFVLQRDVPCIIEVNPRYTASMELFEDLTGESLFDLHLRALEGGCLPPGPLGRPSLQGSRRPPRGAARFLGKGILYADSDVRVADPADLADLGCRDIPIPGEIVHAGQPLCTVVAAGGSAGECRRNLLDRAAEVRRRLLPAEAPVRRRSRGTAAPDRVSTTVLR